MKPSSSQNKKIMDRLDLIAQIPLFKELPGEYHKDLATIAEEKNMAGGEILFSEGEEGSGFYILVFGRVKVFKLSTEGKEQILHVFGPGEPIGEVAAFEGKPFPASAECLEAGKLFFFPRADFLELISRNPGLGLSMLGLLSRRLRRFTSLIEDLSLKEVPARLAAYLVYLSETQEQRENLRLDISKGQLSSLLGTIPETLSRILSRMTKAGLIKPEGLRRIRIVDPQGLRELAEGERRLERA